LIHGQDVLALDVDVDMDVEMEVEVEVIKRAKRDPRKNHTKRERPEGVGGQDNSNK